MPAKRLGEPAGSEAEKRGSKRVIGNRSTFRIPEKVRAQIVALWPGRGPMIRKFGLVREFPPQPVGGKAVRMHGLRARCASNDGFNREALHRLGEATRREVRHQARQARQEGGAEAQEETRSPKRAGRWVCLTQQPPPVTGCVEVEVHSACAPRLLRGHGRTYPHTALSRALGRPLLRG